MVKSSTDFDRLIEELHFKHRSINYDYVPYTLAYRSSYITC